MFFHPAPAELDDIAYAVQAARHEDGALCVTFFWGGGFPVRHTVFFHGPAEACREEHDTFRLVPIEGDWFAGAR